jgi:hypothetical protein
MVPTGSFLASFAKEVAKNESNNSFNGASELI